MKTDTKNYSSLSYDGFDQPTMSEIIDSTGDFFSIGTIGGFFYHLLKARSVLSALANAPRVGGFCALYPLLVDVSYCSIAAACNCNFNMTEQFALETALFAGAGAIMWYPRGLRAASCAALCCAALNGYLSASNIYDTRDLFVTSKTNTYPHPYYADYDQKQKNISNRLWDRLKSEKDRILWAK